MQPKVKNKPRSLDGQTTSRGSAGHPLSQQILRTDVSGMPLEWSIREAARLYHTESGVHLRDAALSPVGGNLREDRPTNGGRREFDHRDPRTHRNPGNLRGAAYTPPLNNQTLFRRDAYLCLYRFALSVQLLSPITSRLSAAAARHLGQRRVGLPPLQQREASRSRSRRHAAAACRSPDYAEYISSRPRVLATRWNT